MEIKASLQRTIYRGNKDFFVAVFKDKEKKTYFRAKGNRYSLVKDVTYMLEGEYEDTVNHGKTFVAEKISEMKPDAGKGIVKYLQTFAGIGKASANKLYLTYGNGLFEILDEDIERIEEEKVLKKATFEKFSMDYKKRARPGESNLYAYLKTFELRDSVIEKIIARYGAKGLNIVKSNPYEFVEIPGFDFRLAEIIAKENNLEVNSPDRFKGAFLYALKENEFGGTLLRDCNKRFKSTSIPEFQSGNTCVVWSRLCCMVATLLERELNTTFKDEMATCLRSLERAKRVYQFRTYENDRLVAYIYRAEIFEEETSIAAKLKDHRDKATIKDFGISAETVKKEQDIERQKGQLSGILSDEQCNAVCTALNNPVSIITGGPGTGKTTIMKTLIHMAEIYYSANIICVAPTGRAARRMSESVGEKYKATTIHSALKLHTGETNNKAAQMIDCDMILIDEFSMVDSSIARILFCHLPKKTRVVLVGDDQQLPSVGPGAVLRELINSEEFPVAKLTNVYRQEKGSSIGTNAKRMAHGNTKMQLDDSFCFIEKTSSKEIADEVLRLYKENLKEFDIEDIMILTPYRKRTETGVNQLNERLQEIVLGEKKKGFCKGDKVMYTQNSDGLANGDVGIVMEEHTSDGHQVLGVDFGTGELKKIEGSSLDNLVLAYSTTIHKSQGSEASLVILISDPAHSLMLKRNLVYTAVTRAKQKVIIIGSMDAFAKAIEKEETNVRVSNLGNFMRENVEPPAIVKEITDNREIQFRINKNKENDKKLKAEEQLSFF